MIDISEKQRKWAESYIQHFNGTRACREAGYKGSDNVLAQQAIRNIRNANIQAFMREVLHYDKEKERNRSIATMSEVMEFYSQGMRGEVKDQFGLDAQFSDRIKCANSLDKILSMAEKAKDSEADDSLTINTCYGKADGDE